MRTNKPRRTLSGKFLTASLGLFMCLGAQAFTGDYQVSGRNPDGSSYQGSVSIQANPGGSCSVAWAVSGESFKGRCVQRGRALAVAFQSGAGEGLAVYEKEGDGRLTGTWTGPGAREFGEEILTPKR